MTRSNRSGFSLPEVLVATVLLGVIGGALTRLVVDQMRFFDNMGAVRGARSVSRNSMNVITADLRMVQDSGGVTAASTSSITVRIPYRVGVFCGSGATYSTVSMLPTDSASLAFAKYGGYGWHNARNASSNYTYVTPADPVASAPVASSSASTCTTTAGINTVSVNGRSGQILDIAPTIAASTPPGSPVFFFQTVTYSFAASSLYPGMKGLWRSVQNGVNEELMAPFTASAGFRYFTSGTDVSSATVPANLNTITGVDLLLYAEGSRTPAGKSAPPEQRMVTAVFFKNVR